MPNNLDKIEFEIAVLNGIKNTRNLTDKEQFELELLMGLKEESSKKKVDSVSSLNGREQAQESLSSQQSNPTYVDGQQDTSLETQQQDSSQYYRPLLNTHLNDNSQEGKQPIQDSSTGPGTAEYESMFADELTNKPVNVVEEKQPIQRPIFSQDNTVNRNPNIPIDTTRSNTNEYEEKQKFLKSLGEQHRKELLEKQKAAMNFPDMSKGKFDIQQNKFILPKEEEYKDNFPELSKKIQETNKELIELGKQANSLQVALSNPTMSKEDKVMILQKMDEIDKEIEIKAKYINDSRKNAKDPYLGLTDEERLDKKANEKLDSQFTKERGKLLEMYAPYGNIDGKKINLNQEIEANLQQGITDFDSYVKGMAAKDYNVFIKSQGMSKEDLLRQYLNEELYPSIRNDLRNFKQSDLDKVFNMINPIPGLINNDLEFKDIVGDNPKGNVKADPEEIRKKLQQLMVMTALVDKGVSPESIFQNPTDSFLDNVIRPFAAGLGGFKKGVRSIATLDERLGNAPFSSVGDALKEQSTINEAIVKSFNDAGLTMPDDLKESMKMTSMDRIDQTISTLGEIIPELAAGGAIVKGGIGALSKASSLQKYGNTLVSLDRLRNSANASTKAKFLSNALIGGQKALESGLTYQTAGTLFDAPGGNFVSGVAGGVAGQVFGKFFQALKTEKLSPFSRKIADMMGGGAGETVQEIAEEIGENGAKFLEMMKDPTERYWFLAQTFIMGAAMRGAGGHSEQGSFLMDFAQKNLDKLPPELQTKFKEETGIKEVQETVKQDLSKWDIKEPTQDLSILDRIEETTGVKQGETKQETPSALPTKVLDVAHKVQNNLPLSESDQDFYTRNTETVDQAIKDELQQDMSSFEGKEGAYVDYEGVKGTLAKNEYGWEVRTHDGGSVFIEGSGAYGPNQIAGLSIVIDRDYKPILEGSENADVELLNFNNNSIQYANKSYPIQSVQHNSKTNEVESITVLNPQTNETIEVKNPDVLFNFELANEIEVQKITPESLVDMLAQAVNDNNLPQEVLDAVEKAKIELERKEAKANQGQMSLFSKEKQLPTFVPAKTNSKNPSIQEVNRELNRLLEKDAREKQPTIEQPTEPTTTIEGPKIEQSTEIQYEGNTNLEQTTEGTTTTSSTSNQESSKSKSEAKQRIEQRKEAKKDKKKVGLKTSTKSDKSTVSYSEEISAQEKNQDVEEELSETIDNVDTSTESEKIGPNEVQETVDEQIQATVEEVFDEEKEAISEIAQEENVDSEQVKRNVLKEIANKFKDVNYVFKKGSKKIINLIKKVYNSVVKKIAILSAVAISSFYVYNNTNLIQYGHYFLAKNGVITMGVDVVNTNTKTSFNDNVQITEKINADSINTVQSKREAIKKSIKKGFELIATAIDYSSKGGKSPLMSYRSQWINEDGFVYILTHSKQNANMDNSSVWNNVEGVGHFIIDTDITGENQSLSMDLKPNQWNPVYEKVGDGKYKLVYKKSEDVKSTDLRITQLIQFKGNEIDWNKTKDMYKSAKEILSTKGEATGLLYGRTNKTGSKDSYGRFNGNSVVFIFDVNGITVVRDFAGSINQIKLELESISKSYNIPLEQITLGRYDAGSFSAKPKAKDGKLSREQWDHYNPNDGGSAMIIPQQNNSITEQKQESDSKGNKAAIDIVLMLSLLPSLRKKKANGTITVEEEKQLEIAEALKQQQDIITQQQKKLENKAKQEKLDAKKKEIKERNDAKVRAKKIEAEKKKEQALEEKKKESIVKAEEKTKGERPISEKTTKDAQGNKVPVPESKTAGKEREIRKQIPKSLQSKLTEGIKDLFTKGKNLAQIERQVAKRLNEQNKLIQFGVKYGLQQKKEFERRLIAFANTYTKLDAKGKNKLATLVRNAKTEKDVENAIDKIWDIDDEVQRSKKIDSVKKLFSQLSQNKKLGEFGKQIFNEIQSTITTQKKSSANKRNIENAKILQQKDNIIEFGKESINNKESFKDKVIAFAENNTALNQTDYDNISKMIDDANEYNLENVINDINDILNKNIVYINLENEKVLKQRTDIIEFGKESINNKKSFKEQVIDFAKKNTFLSQKDYNTVAEMIDNANESNLENVINDIEQMLDDKHIERISREKQTRNFFEKENTTPNNKLQQKLEIALDKLSIYDMTIDEIADLEQRLSTLMRNDALKKRMRKIQRERSHNKKITELKERLNQTATKKPAAKSDAQARKEMRERFKKYLVKNAFSLRTIATMMDKSTTGPIMKYVHDVLEKGNKKAVLIRNQAKDVLMRGVTPEIENKLQEYSDAFGGENTTKKDKFTVYTKPLITTKDRHGNIKQNNPPTIEVELTKGDQIAIYKLLMNPKSAVQVLYGGLSFDGDLANRFILKQSDIQQIIDTINNDPNLKLLTDNISNVSNEVLSPAVQEAYKAVTGTPLVVEDNHFPARVNPMYIADKYDRDVMQDTMRPNFYQEPTLKNSGFVKAKKGVIVPLILEDAFVTAKNMIDTYSNYAGKLEGIEDVKYFLEGTKQGNTGQEGAYDVMRKYNEMGEDYVKYIRELIKDEEGLGHLGKEMDNTTDKLIGLYTKQKLFWNAASAVLQLSSSLLALGDIKTSLLFKNAVKSIGTMGQSNSLISFDEIKKMSPENRERFEGYFDEERGMLANEEKMYTYFTGNPRTKSPIKKIGDFGGEFMAFFDKLNVQIIFSAVRDELLAGKYKDLAKFYEGNKKVTSETKGIDAERFAEFQKEWIKKAEFVVEDTQPTNPAYTKSGIQRSKNQWIKSLTLFSSQRNKIFNKLVRSSIEWKNGKMSTKKFQLIISGGVASAAFSALIQQLRDEARKAGKEDDENDENNKLASQLALKFFANTVEIVYFSNFVTDAIKAASGEKVFDLQNPVYDTANKIHDLFIAVGKAKSEEFITTAIDLTGLYSGLPLERLRKNAKYYLDFDFKKELGKLLENKSENSSFVGDEKTREFERKFEKSMGNFEESNKRLEKSMRNFEEKQRRK